MRSIKRSRSRIAVGSLVFLFAITCFPHSASAETKVPKSLLALAPASVQLSSRGFEVYDADEFGYVAATGELHGSFPEYRRCAYAAGPEFTLNLGIDPAWEASPGQLATWEEMFLSELDFEGAPERLVESIRLKITEAAGAPVVGTPVVEKLPGGHIAYVEFVWKCAGNPSGANTILQGYALRGSTSLEFNFWVYAGRAEAIAMASEIFTAFEKLDIPELFK